MASSIKIRKHKRINSHTFYQILLKIEEYLETLPENLLSGEDVQLPEKSFREIFKFVKLDKDDIFYHLGM